MQYFCISVGVASLASISLADSGSGRHGHGSACAEGDGRGAAWQGAALEAPCSCAQVRVFEANQTLPPCPTRLDAPSPPSYSQSPSSSIHTPATQRSQPQYSLNRACRSSVKALLRLYPDARVRASGKVQACLGSVFHSLRRVDSLACVRVKAFMKTSKTIVLGS